MAHQFHESDCKGIGVMRVHSCISDSSLNIPKFRSFCYNKVIVKQRKINVAYLKEKIELSLDEAGLEIQSALTSFSSLQQKLLILIVILLIPSYFLAEKITFFAESSSYRQQAVLATPSFTNPQKVTFSDPIITKTGSTVYSAAVKISNPNLALSLDNVPYQFLLFNSSHQQIFSGPGTLYLLPGESKYLMLPRADSQQSVTSLQIQLPDTLPWQKRLTIPTVKLIPDAPALSNQTAPQTFVAQGTVYNNSPYQLGQITINFFLLSSSDQIIGMSQRSEFSLAPFERRAYKQLWPGVFSTDVTGTQVTAYTDTLDPSNVTAPMNTNSNAGSLVR